MSCKVVIPARYASSRLPGKPLADIGGKPMVVRVLERAVQSSADEVWVATDHEGIFAAVEQHGFRAIRTRADHPSGTDRIAEVADQLGWHDDCVVVNVQGDEPFIDPALIDRVAAELMADADARMTTVCQPIETTEEFLDPNVVKVVCDARGHALYFSRAPIPWPREAFARSREHLPIGFAAWRHIGMYAYRCGFLRQWGRLAPAPLESVESLEQLRALWHGARVRVIETGRADEFGVDTAADLQRARQRFAEA